MHRGKRDMPANKDFWSSWNYASDNERNYRCTYWLKPLQNTKDDELFATMHGADYNPENMEKLNEWVCDHSSYDENTQKCVDYIKKYNSHWRVHGDMVLWCIYRIWFPRRWYRKCETYYSNNNWR